MTKNMTISVEDGEEGLRLDRFLVTRLEGFTRSAIQRIIENGKVMLKGKPVSANHKTHPLEKFSVEIPPPDPASAEAEDIPLDIVYEDADIVIVNKPVGMVVHPAKGHFTGTLVNALLHRCTGLSGIGGEMRPGIVHRLDKETSGLIAVAKHDASHNALSGQLKSRTMGREYLAVVRGVVRPPQGTIDKPIGRHNLYRKKMTVHPKKSSGARDAITLYETIENFKESTLLRVKLKTGRTHQIRVHLSAIGYPILGDTVYGKDRAKLISRPALHAAKLTLVHPTTGKTMVFETPPPPDLSLLLDKLRKG